MQKVALIDYFDKKAILKQRFRKSYRHPTLDQKLLTKRITQEVRCLARAFKCGVPCPIVYFVDPREGTIIMEYINGPTAKEAIILNSQNHSIDNDNFISLQRIAMQIGQLIASCHANDLIHGDLTTSNILFRTSDLGFEAVLIDFGLAQVSNMTEDKAVDLYVLERAISSTHPEAHELFPLILEAYADNLDISTGKGILNKLAEVEGKEKVHGRLKGRLIKFNDVIDELVL